MNITDFFFINVVGGTIVCLGAMVKIQTRARLTTSLLRRCSRLTSLLLPKSKLEAPQKVNGTTRRRTVAEHLTTLYEHDLYLNLHGGPAPAAGPRFKGQTQKDSVSGA